MSRPGVSYEDVSKVAGALLSQGMHPSVQRVRNQLGTGSNTTIDRHLKNWQETFKQEKPTVLPETVPEELMQPMESFWQTAMAHAEENYQHFKENLLKKVEEAESAKVAALLRLEERNTEYQELEARQNNTQSENESLTASLRHLEGEYKANLAHVTEIKEQADQSVQLAKSNIQDYQRQVETLENALATQKETETKRATELEARVQDERKRGEDAESRLLVDIDTLRQNVKQKDTVITTQEKDLKVLTRLAHERQTELQAQQMYHEKSENELSDKLNQNREALAQAGKRELNLQKQLSDATGLLEKIQQTLNKAHSREITLVQQVAKLETDLISVRSTQAKKGGNKN